MSSSISMTPIISLRDFCRANRDWLLETTEALVGLESPTTDKAAVDRCGAALASRLEAIGGRVTRLPRPDRGDHLLAEFGCGTSQILLLGHFDTVWPVGQLDRMPLTRSGGRLHGPGVFDMKAGIAIAMLATRALLEAGAARSPHRHALDDRRGDRQRVVARGDRGRGAPQPRGPRAGAVAARRRGEDVAQGMRLLSADGARRRRARRDRAAERRERRAGAGAPDPARQRAAGSRARHLRQRRAGVGRPALERDPRRSARHGGRPRADRGRGGGEIDAAFRALRAVDGRTTVEAAGGIDRPPLERTGLVERLYKQARDVARELGQELAEGGTGGGSDGNFTAALGVPTLDGLGAIGDGAHALHEHVDIETLPDRAALVAGLITRPTRIAKLKAMNNTVKTALLLGTMSALLMLIGEALGGAGGMVFGFFFAVATNFASYWFSDKIVLRMYNAQEVGPGHRLFDVVDRLAKRAGLPQPRCYVIPDASPNAFATGRNPEHAAVAATEGILRLLTDEELEGVLAHELAHVKHRDILISSVAATLAAAIMMISRFAMFFGGSGNGRDDREGSNPFALLATIILAPIAAMLIQAAISRSREFDADAGGAAIAGGPNGLVSALRKIEVASKQIPLDANPATAHMFIIKPFSASSLLGLFSTHPPTADRIQALLQQR